MLKALGFGGSQPKHSASTQSLTALDEPYACALPLMKYLQHGGNVVGSFCQLHKLKNKADAVIQ